MKQFIGDLKEGDRVESVFLIKERKMVDFRSKPGRYLHLVLQDRSGEMEARMWEDGETYFQVCQTSKVIFVTGEVLMFRDTLQIRITNLRVPSLEEYQPEDFVNVSIRPPEDMSLELEGLIADMRPGPLREVALAFLNSSWYPAFCRAPAAQSYHHNYIGGLLEHTLGVARVALGIAGVYGGIDRDLLLLGALLHDIGKIKEMAFTPGIEYTDEGKLLGHIILGIDMANELMGGIASVKPQVKNQILHLIASHHGEYEWQSPKRPKFLEAKILHLADLADAEVYKFNSATPSEPGGNWSPYIRGLRNQVYLGTRNHRLGGDKDGKKE